MKIVLAKLVNKPYVPPIEKVQFMLVAFALNQNPAVDSSAIFACRALAPPIP